MGTLETCDAALCMCADSGLLFWACSILGSLLAALQSPFFSALKLLSSLFHSNDKNLERHIQMVLMHRLPLELSLAKV